MIDRKESCTSGRILMTDLSCLAYVLEEWTVVEYLKKYLFHVLIISLAISAILVFFIVPLTIVFFIYLSNILLLIYQRSGEVKADPLSDVWDSARKAIASFWDVCARIWHGYELHGVENLPEGPGILVYYHGAIPIDYLYFLSRLFLQKKRLCLSVADHFVFRLPGFFRQLYESTRLPFTPPYGGLPVKFRTYIGEPIPYDPNITTEELVEKTKTAVQTLISKHQTIPGSMWKALLERFDKCRKSD